MTDDQQEERMVYVQLDKEWTDPEGTTHAAGETVDVDAGTLATLEAKGIVTDPDEQPEPAGDDADSWPGPTGGGTDSWPGPTGGGTEGSG